MAAKPRRLRLAVTSDALAALSHIWTWNAEHWGTDHAERYSSFLRSEITKLETTYPSGRPVPTRPGFQYTLIRRRRRGHGHVAVYEVVGDVIYVLEIFHTAQDWQKKIADR